MAGVNKVILLGNLGQDPDVTTLQSGMKVAKFSVATSESYTDKQGQKVDNTEWHRVEMWDKLADISERYLKKGSTVYVEGKIKTEKYTDKDGIEKQVIKIRGTAINLVGSKSNENQESQHKAQTQAPPTAPSVSDLPSYSGDEDLPF
jgi:single-strand DNA-binding protein